jgi:glycosyltransferase involved in cell wall biosynthesis
MRVGYIVPSLDDTTGWGRWANDLLRHITGCGVEPVIYAPASSARFVARGAPFGCHFVLPELFDYVQSSSGLRRLPAVRSLLRTGHPGKLDLIHSLDAHPWGLYGDYLARRHGVPHIMTTHGRYGYIAENRFVDRILYRRVLHKADALVAVSDAVRRAVLREFTSEIGGRVVVLQNPVDHAQFTTAGALPHDVPTRGPVLVSVTRFTPVKDIETAVMAFQQVKRLLPDASFYVIGPGNGEGNAYYCAVRDLIEREKIEGVHIIGRVSKDVLAAFYHRASLLVHTARTLADDFEASGLILLEAGLFELPAVATDSGGISEVVEHDVTGCLVPERDPAALAEAIVTLLLDPPTLARLGAANRQRALERNWSAYCQEQVRIYANAARLDLRPSWSQSPPDPLPVGEPASGTDASPPAASPNLPGI